MQLSQLAGVAQSRFNKLILEFEFGPIISIIPNKILKSYEDMRK